MPFIHASSAANHVFVAAMSPQPAVARRGRPVTSPDANPSPMSTNPTHDSAVDQPFKTRWR